MPAAGGIDVEDVGVHRDPVPRRYRTGAAHGRLAAGAGRRITGRGRWKKLIEEGLC
jgi:hypothetical protein